MKHFLSGFSDADAEVILKHCREVLSPDGKILLLQVCAPPALVTAPLSADKLRAQRLMKLSWRSELQAA